MYHLILAIISSIIVIIIVVVGYFLYHKQFNDVTRNYSQNIDGIVDTINSYGQSKYIVDVDQNKALDANTQAYSDLQGISVNDVSTLKQQINDLSSFEKNNTDSISKHLKAMGKFNISNELSGFNKNIQTYKDDLTKLSASVNSLPIEKQTNMMTSMGQDLDNLMDASSNMSSAISTIQRGSADNIHETNVFISNVDESLTNYLRQTEMSDYKTQIDGKYETTSDFDKYFTSKFYDFQHGLSSYAVNSDLTKYATNQDVTKSMNNLIKFSDLNNIVQKSELEQNYAPIKALNNLAPLSTVEQNYATKTYLENLFNLSQLNINKINNQIMNLSGSFGTQHTVNSLLEMTNSISSSIDDVQAQINNVYQNYVTSLAFTTTSAIESAEQSSEATTLKNIQDNLTTTWANMSNIGNVYLTKTTAANTYTQRADYDNLKQIVEAFPTNAEIAVKFGKTFAPYVGFSNLQAAYNALPNFDATFVKLNDFNAVGTLVHVLKDDMADVITDLSGMSGQKTYEYGQGVKGKQTDAGKMGYNAFSQDALDIVGAGSTVGNRLVRMYDNVTIGGNLTLGQVCLNKQCSPSPHPGPTGPRGPDGPPGPSGPGGNFSWDGNQFKYPGNLDINYLNMGNSINARSINLTNNGNITITGDDILKINNAMGYGWF